MQLVEWQSERLNSFRWISCLRQRKLSSPKQIADFLAEWIEQQLPTQVHSEHWTMFFDGSKMLNGSGAGVVLVSPRGDKLRYVLQIHFDSSNNEAEYEALLYGLRMAIYGLWRLRFGS